MDPDVHHLLEAHTGDDSCRCLASCLELTLSRADPATAARQVVAILERCLQEHPAGTHYRHNIRWR